MNKLRHFALFLLLSISTAGMALPKITEVRVTDGTCLANGELKILVEGTEGTVRYAIIAPQDYATPVQTENTFTGLPAGTYTVGVYDVTTGGTPVTAEATVKTTYPKFLLNPPSASVDGSQSCQDNGTLYVSYIGGRAPYNITITNTDTQQEWTQQTNSTGHSFTGLPSGKYQVMVKDNCEEYRTTINATTVTSTGELGNITFDSFKASNPYIYGNGSCEKIIIRYYYSYFQINGSNTLPSTYYQTIKYRIEYPAGSGTYTPWLPANYYAYFNINNFDSTKTQYRVQVLHPCSQAIVTDPTTYTIDLKVNYSVINGVYRYDGFCDPTHGVYIQKNTSGVNDYVCGEYPYTVTFTPVAGGAAKTYNNWTSGNAYWVTGLEPGVQYKTKITDKNGMVLKDDLTITTSAAGSLTPYSLQPYVYSDAYMYRCDFSSMILYIQENYQYPSGSRIRSGKVTFSIEEGPVTRDPIVKDFDQSSYNYYLWDDLPYGTYKIKVAYDCGREDFYTISRNQSYKEFKEVSLSPSNAAVCGRYNLTVTPYAFNMNDQVASFSAYMFLYRVNSDGSKTLVSSAGSSSYTFSNLDGGNYYVEVKPYYYSSSPWGENCTFGSAEISLPDYNPPRVNIPLSGGITCLDESVARLTVTAEGDREPYAYRIKKEGEEDSKYTPFQNENIFQGQAPGKYVAQVRDGCGSITTQELRVFYGKDQFLVIEGELEPGVVCSGKSTVFSVLSVGPVESYAWYRDQGNGYELISGENGPKYILENTTSEDIGFYKVVINNGYCDLESAVELKRVVPSPGTPVLTSECTDAGTLLTAKVSGDVVAYTWYKDGERISGADQSTYLATALGDYTVTVRSSGGCVSDLSNTVSVSPVELYWSATAQNSNWNDPQNWSDASGNAMNAVPSACTNVHIPGNAATYPDLSEAFTPRDKYGDPICNYIWFHFGGEVAKPHLLTYNKAFVRYNFGYNDNVNDVYYNGDPHAAEPMKRDRWYALSAPLNKIASGDFSVGGYPNIWRQSFRTTTGSYGEPVGDWYVPTAGNALEIDASQYYALSVWAGNLQPAVGESDHANLNALQGYLEMPYFENPAISSLHRIHIYGGGVSRFLYYNSLTLELYPEWQQMPGRITRRNEAYRFIFDKKIEVYKGEEVFRLSVPAGEDVMVGNPFLSSLDFDKLYEFNSDVLEDFYRLYEHPWNTYAVRASELIPSFQAFFIKTKGRPGTNTTIYFPVSASVTRSGNYTLKSSVKPENVLFVEAIGETGTGKSVVSFNDELYSRSVPQLFVNATADSVSARVPQLFVSDSDGSRNVIHKVNSSVSAVELNLGLRSTAAGQIRLRFDNVTGVEASGLLLRDNHTGIETNLLMNNEYSFRNVPGLENRFTLFVKGLRSTTGLDPLPDTTGSVKVYVGEKTLFVSSSNEITDVSLTTVQGVRVFTESGAGRSEFAKPLTVENGVYIVTVKCSDNTVKNEKIVVK